MPAFPVTLNALWPTGSRTAKVANVHAARTMRSALLSEVEGGEKVTIPRNGVPVARPVAVATKIDRRPRLLAGRKDWEHFVYDPGLFAAMTDERLQDEGWQ